MLKYDDINSARENYIDHPLFKNCIEIWCPKGWIIYLDKIVSRIEEYNSECPDKHQVRFAQVKIKFGMLTVYIESLYESEGWAKSARDADIYNFINSVCRDALQHCTFCGNELVKMVIDSNIKHVCWDHMPNGRRYDGKV